jgi:seryl-tRNA synthetase
MLDIKLLREQPSAVRQNIINKNEKANIDRILELDGERRSIIAEADVLKNKRNTVSEQIAQLKKNKENADTQIAEMKVVSDTIKGFDEQLRVIEAEQNELMLYVPNMAHESVPVGKDLTQNIEVRSTIEKTEQGWRKNHLEISQELGILDFERGAKVSGSGFGFYVGKGAMLERALLNFFLDTHTSNHGYKEIMPPFAVNEASMRGTGQLPKFGEDMYKCADDDLYLIPTAEVPLTNYYRDDVLPLSELPIKFTGYSACFRREAGSYGKDSRGFLRVHQFNKIELVKFTTPSSSYDELESLVVDVENILQALELPHRVILLCTGDMSFGSAKTYDLEVWSPCEQKYLEVSSCSNFESYQARRANIRFRNSEGKLEFVHTLNGSGLATSRIMVALLEQHQQEDGSIRIPSALRPYTRFDEIRK